MTNLQKQNRRRKYAFLFLLPLLFSCITRQKCEERFPPQVRDSIITKDSLVYVHDTITIPGADVIIRDSIPCPDYHKEIKKGSITATIDIKRGKLSVECKEDSLRKIINEQWHLISTTKSKVEVHHEIEYITHWYDMMSRWMAGILFLVLVGWIISKIK